MVHLQNSKSLPRIGTDGAFWGMVQGDAGFLAGPLHKGLGSMLRILNFVLKIVKHHEKVLRREESL